MTTKTKTVRDQLQEIHDEIEDILEDGLEADPVFDAEVPLIRARHAIAETLFTIDQAIRSRNVS